VEAGPPIEALTRRLAECPAEFLENPRLGTKDGICVTAVVSDLLEALGGAPLSAQDSSFEDVGPKYNWLRTVLVATWLLHDQWFRTRGNLATLAHPLLVEHLVEMSKLVQAPQLVADQDRREELARICLKYLQLLPAGETQAQADDRLTTISTSERLRVIKEAQAAEARAREIREAMARKAAEEAAAHYSRE
jgi:hypothetical protein